MLSVLALQMLIMRQFDGVEKIKTVGSTYMAASGLGGENEEVGWSRELPGARLTKT